MKSQYDIQVSKYGVKFKNPVDYIPVETIGFINNAIKKLNKGKWYNKVKTL